MPEPGGLKEWWREMRGEPAPSHVVQTPMQSAVTGLRHNAEGAVVATLLALIDTDLGGLDMGGRVPLEWVGAAVFYALSIRDSANPDGLASDYRAMGQTCTSIATYRMIHKWREASKDIPRNTSSGDPVLAAGKSSAF